MGDPVCATEVRRHFRAVLCRIAAGERVIVESHGRPVAAVVSVADAEMMAALDRYLAGRDLQTDDGAEDWTSVFPGLAELEL